MAFFAALGVLPRSLKEVPVTTCSWQQRLLSAFVGPRATEGQLHLLARSIDVPLADVLGAIGAPDPTRLVVADPRPVAVEIARHRNSGANQLAAETIAVAESLGAVVVVSEANAEGHVPRMILGAGIELEIWRAAPRA